MNYQLALLRSLDILGPYPGLRPYRRNESLIFFGRERLVDQMKDKLRAARFLGVVGSSGCGKSSLVKAGLFPALDSGFLVARDLPWSRYPNWAASRWFTVDMQPRHDPYRGLSDGLLKSGLLGECWPATDPINVAALEVWLREGPRQLLRLWEQAQNGAGPQANLLILVDQFEELFRFRDPQQTSQSQAFVSLLLDLAAQPEWPVYVAITMRSDFLGDCSQFPGLPEALNNGQFLVPRLTTKEIQSTIEGPARLFGVEVESRLVTRILNDFGSDSDQLPLLQHALKRTWDLASPSSDVAETRRLPGAAAKPLNMLHLSDYDCPQVRGVAEALDLHAEALFEKLAGDDEQRGDKRLARLLFQCLTIRDANNRDVRRPTPIRVIAAVAEVEPAEIIRIADIFRHPDCSFLTPDPSRSPALKADDWLDVGHESLLRQWKRLRRWIGDESEIAIDLDRLVQDAASWHAGERGLLHEPELSVLERLRAKIPSTAWATRCVTAEEFSLADTYLKQSRDAENKRVQEEAAAQQLKLTLERQRAAEAEAKAVAVRQSELKNYAIFAATLAVVAMAVATWKAVSANAERVRAEVAKKKAHSNARLAENNLAKSYIALGRAAFEKKDIDAAVLRWTTSLYIGAHATQNDSSRNLIGAWSPRERRLIHESVITATACSPDGQTVLTASFDGTVRLWDNRTGTRRGEQKMDSDVVTAAAFSQDSQTVVMGSEKGMVRLWNTKTDFKREFHGPGKVIMVKFRRDVWEVFAKFVDLTELSWDMQSGNRIKDNPDESNDRPIASSSNDSSCFNVFGSTMIKLREVQTNIPSRYLTDFGPMLVMASSRDGRRILTGTEEKPGEARLWDVAAGQCKTLQDCGEVTAAAFSWDGRMVLTWSSNNTTRLWDAQNGKRLGKLPLTHSDTVRAVAFSPDGRMVLTGSSDKTARLWDTKTGDLRGEPLIHSDTVRAVAFSPDGRMVLTGSSDKTARLWDATTGDPRGEPLIHSDTVRAVAFSPDGQTLLTGSGGFGSNSGEAQLWDAGSGTPRGEPMKLSQRVIAAAFSPDGQTVRTWIRDGTEWIWPVPPPAIDDREHPERLQLSVEVRTGKRLDDGGGVRLLTFDEWNTRRLKLETLGGPCDQPTWEQYNAWKSKQTPPRRSPASRP